MQMLEQGMFGCSIAATSVRKYAIMQRRKEVRPFVLRKKWKFQPLLFVT
jgi:hypothetical protein